MNKTLKTRFTSVYKKYYQALVKYTYYKVSNVDLAEELTQEAFLKTWLYVKVSKNKVTDYKNFLYRVTKNLVIDFYKQKNKIPLSLEVVNNKEFQVKNTLDKVIDNKVKYNYLVNAIKELEPKYKKILTDRFINQLSINNICDKTNMSPNQVSVMIYRGLNVLKEKIKTEKKEPSYAI